jgi:hypothetical protein
MHQTTVRFGPDLWEALEAECARLGVSAAQYLREAALARLSYTAGRRRDPDYAEAYAQLGPQIDERATAAPDEETAPALATQSESSEQVLAASALTAQSELVRRRSQRVRAEAAALRRQRREQVM